MKKFLLICLSVFILSGFFIGYVNAQSDIEIPEIKIDKNTGSENTNQANTSNVSTNSSGKTSTTGSTGSSYTVDVGTFNLPNSKFPTVQSLILGVINWLFYISGILATFAIIYSGLMYIMSGGDTEKANTAKKYLTYSIVGMVIIMLSIWIVNLLNDAIGGGDINNVINTGSSTSQTSSGGNGNSLRNATERANQTSRFVRSATKALDVSRAILEIGLKNNPTGWAIGPTYNILNGIRNKK